MHEHYISDTVCLTALIIFQAFYPENVLSVDCICTAIVLATSTWRTDICSIPIPGLKKLEDTAGNNICAH